MTSPYIVQIKKFYNDHIKAHVVEVIDFVKPKYEEFVAPLVKELREKLSDARSKAFSKMVELFKDGCKVSLPELKKLNVPVILQDSAKDACKDPQRTVSILLKTVAILFLFAFRRTVLGLFLAPFRRRTKPTQANGAKAKVKRA